MSIGGALLVLAGFVSAGFLGFIIGHHYGVKETERRWSEAVTKADHARELQARQ